MSMNIADPAVAYERLRAETAAMLKLNPDSSSLVEGLQVDLVSLLRLEVDTLQGQVLAGEQVDLARLVTAHGMLQKMLPERALVAPAPAAATHDFSGAREELARFLAQRAERIEARELKESERLRAEVARSCRSTPPEPPSAPPTSGRGEITPTAPLARSARRAGRRLTNGGAKRRSYCVNSELPKLEKAVASAEQVVVDLQNKRAAAAARVEAIAATRKKLGFAVHAGGDKDARAQLDKLNLEDATLAGEIQSLDGALIEAGHRLGEARQTLAREERRAAIKEAAEAQQGVSRAWPVLGQGNRQPAARPDRAQAEREHSRPRFPSCADAAPSSVGRAF